MSGKTTCCCTGADRSVHYEKARAQTSPEYRAHSDQTEAGGLTKNRREPCTRAGVLRKKCARALHPAKGRTRSRPLRGSVRRRGITRPRCSREGEKRGGRGKAGYRRIQLRPGVVLPAGSARPTLRRLSCPGRPRNGGEPRADPPAPIYRTLRGFSVGAEQVVRCTSRLLREEKNVPTLICADKISDFYPDRGAVLVRKLNNTTMARHHAFGQIWAVRTHSVFKSSPTAQIYTFLATTARQ